MGSIQVIKRSEIEANASNQEPLQADMPPVHDIESEVRSWVEFHREHGVHDPTLGRLFPTRRRMLARAGGII